MGFAMTFGQLRVQAASSPEVVAAHSILGDWVREVAGPGVSVRVFVGPNAVSYTHLYP